MSKLSAALGKKYESAVMQIRTRTFTIGGHEFKVRVPLSAEMTAMHDRILMIDKDKAELKFQEMTKELVNNPPAGVEVKDDDVFLDGKSTRELVKSVLIMENRVVEYIRLLVPVNGNLDDITYEEVEAEWPLSVQMEIMDCISNAIQPGYKDARKNS